MRPRSLCSRRTTLKGLVDPRQVTQLDKYAAYLSEDDFPLDVLLRDLRGQTPRTPAMERGHAFAKAMEQVTPCCRTCQSPIRQWSY